MQLLLVFVCGLIFGLGLIVSGMSNPANVIGFLDLAGNWNPGLALVMGGAIPVAFLGFRWIESRRATLFGDPLHLPGTSQFNWQLMAGSLIFGAGWAMAGFCPGPALVALGAGHLKALIFVLAMLAGMILHDRVYARLSATA